MKTNRTSEEWPVVSGQWSVGGRRKPDRYPLSTIQLSTVLRLVRPTRHWPLVHSPLFRAFTLVELLVTITIIGMLAAMMLGALQVARQAGREYATKATIAKLNNIIMQRYESYLTRRVPIQIPTGTARRPTAAQMRLDAHPRLDADGNAGS